MNKQTNKKLITGQLNKLKYTYMCIFRYIYGLI